MTETCTETVRVVVVADDELVRAGIVAVLGTDPAVRVIAEASDGQQALDLTRRHQSDVVLVDIRMPRWTVSRL